MCADHNCQVGGKPEVVWRQNFKILQNFFLQSKTDCTSAQSNIPVAAQSRPQFFFVDEIYEIKDMKYHCHNYLYQQPNRRRPEVLTKDWSNIASMQATHVCAK